MLHRLILASLGWLVAQGAAQAQDPSFRVVNNTAQVVNEIYVSPPTSNVWGHDRLGSEVVAAGASQIVRLPTDGQCRFDIRVVYQGGTAEERRNLDTCRLTDLVLGGAPNGQAGKSGNPSFHLVNRSGRLIEQLFASPSGGQGWGLDRLGEGTVRAGQRFPIRLPLGECRYDLRVVLQGGTVRERREVDLCELADYVVQ